MTRRKRLPGPAVHPDSTPPDAAMILDGRHLRRYRGTWCAQTIAGGWRRVDWLGAINVHQALDLLHDGHQPEPGLGQLELIR